MAAPDVTGFFDNDTFTISYVVADSGNGKAAIIDSVLDYDQASGRTSTKAADQLIAHVRDQALQVEWILETHVHADHLTAAPYLRDQLGGQIGVGRHITDVQAVFGDIFNLKDLPPDGRQFDVLFDDGDEFAIGELAVRVMHTPGHTPACVTYVVGDAAFVGDTMFMPDYGTARCDFPGGDAAMLYRSIQKILALPDDTRLFMCHDYKAPGRDVFAWETTVHDEREKNIHLAGGVSEASFVEFRQNRDAGLSMPRLILPSIQVNIRAGELPEPEDNGTRYLKMPLDAV